MPQRAGLCVLLCAPGASRPRAMGGRCSSHRHVRFPVPLYATLVPPQTRCVACRNRLDPLPMSRPSASALAVRPFPFLLRHSCSSHASSSGFRPFVRLFPRVSVRFPSVCPSFSGLSRVGPRSSSSIILAPHTRRQWRHTHTDRGRPGPPTLRHNEKLWPFNDPSRPFT